MSGSRLGRGWLDCGIFYRQRLSCADCNCVHTDRYMALLGSRLIRAWAGRRRENTVCEVYSLLRHRGSSTCMERSSGQYPLCSKHSVAAVAGVHLRQLCNSDGASAFAHGNSTARTQSRDAGRICMHTFSLFWPSNAFDAADAVDVGGVEATRYKPYGVSKGDACR
jgi:hypothetical protein